MKMEITMTKYGCLVNPKHHQGHNVLHVGKAQAAANKALVSVGLTPLEKATIEKETAIGVAQALANSQVRWVPEVIVSGSSGTNGTDPLQAVGLNMLLDIAKKQNK